MNRMVSESAEKREAKMSGLISRLAMWIRKRVANAQEETTPNLEVSGSKHSRPSGLDKEVQADPTMITIESLERVLEAPFAIGGAIQDASRKACAVLEDETPVEEPLCVDEASITCRSNRCFIVMGQSHSSWCSEAPDRLVLSSYVEPMEWAKPT